jgi:hypothetical protein
VFERDPNIIEYAYNKGYSVSYGQDWENYDWDGRLVHIDTEPYEDLVRDHPEAVARMLSDYFSSHMDLLEELYEYGLEESNKGFLNRWLR